MIPTCQPSDLSPAARDLYKQAVKAQVRQSSLDLTRNDTTIAAATEIAEAGLGTLYLSERHMDLRVAALAKGFTVAKDTSTDFPGGLYIEVEVLSSPNARTGVLLACLYGARYEQRTNTAPWPTWNIDVRHATARDADHSASYLATLTIEHPVMLNHDGFNTQFVGTLSEARMWATGTDITLIDDQDGDPLDEPAICDYGSCANNPHPYGPFMPPKREDLDRYTGRAVRITTTPIGLVDTNGRHVGTSPVTQG